MINEFSRTQPLIGEEGLSGLSSSTVMVSGVGGVGFHCIEALARCGIGRPILVDPDGVALTNINRQSIVYRSTVGQFKTRVMEWRIMDISPAARVITFERSIFSENLEQLFSEISETIDYAVDAIDTVVTKLALVEHCMAHEIPLLASMETGNKLHGELLEVTDISRTSVCPPCRAVRRELESKGIYHLKILYSKGEPSKPELESEEATSKRAVPGSIFFMLPVMGLLIAGEVVRELSGS